MRYNLGGYRRIALFVDEVSNVINQPLIAVIYDVVCGHEAGNYRPAMLCSVLARNPRIVIPTTSFCFSS